MTNAMRRSGGNWSVQRPDKIEQYETLLYEIDMLRFCYGRVLAPLESAREADVWTCLEAFLVHYRNLLDFFGKTTAGDTDLTLQSPEMIWSAASGLAADMPGQPELDEMHAKGRKLWEKYEDRTKRDDTISRYLQHCTTFRTSRKRWYPVEMMTEIDEILKSFETHLPQFNLATQSAPINRDHFLGGGSMSTQSGTRVDG